MSEIIKIQDDIKVAEALLIMGYKFIARDDVEKLYAFTEEPEKYVDIWFPIEGSSCCVINNEDLFEDVQSRDDYATNLEDFIERNSNK